MAAREALPGARAKGALRRMINRYHRITLGEPRHVDVTDDHASVVVPATMSLNIRGEQITQTGSVFGNSED